MVERVTEPLAGSVLLVAVTSATTLSGVLQ